jgi:hypothetical protein
MNLCELADGNQVVRGGIQYAKELRPRFFEPTELEESPSERDTCRDIRGMLGKTGLANPDSFLAVASAPVLLGKLRKRNRRRIFLNPASKVFNPWVVRHPYIIN